MSISTVKIYVNNCIIFFFILFYAKLNIQYKGDEMMNETIFKAYDIRGKYPDEINENTSYIIGKSYGSYLQKFYSKNKYR